MRNMFDQGIASPIRGTLRNQSFDVFGSEIFAEIVSKQFRFFIEGPS